MTHILQLDASARPGRAGIHEHGSHSRSLTTVLEFIGITDVHSIAVENQEEGGDVLAESVAEAERRVDALVVRLQENLTMATPAMTSSSLVSSA